MANRTSVAAFDAAEMLTHALLRGDTALADRAAAHFDAEAAADLDLPDADVRHAVADADPVSAATLGWLTFPEMASRVLPEPSRFLDPEEAAAVAADPGLLRVVVRARTLGRPFADVRAETPASKSDYDLAARGDTTDARAAYDNLVAQGVFDRRDV